MESDTQPLTSIQNNWWFQVVTLLLIAPLGAILMLCCTGYRQKSTQAVRVSGIIKAILIIVIVPIWLIIFARIVGYENIGYFVGRVYWRATHLPAS